MGRLNRWDNCALCGEYRLTTREHVVPRSLYPSSKSRSKFQRITIASCSDCNNGSSDDDAHFRNVILVAGEPNASATELWDGPTRRAFAQIDGVRRAREIFALMEPVPELGGERYKIYPARDERILRTVRKIVRGLAHFHGIQSAIRDNEIVADVMRYTLPDETIEAMQYHHAEPDVLQYAFVNLGAGPDVRSLWILRFFERTSFVAVHFGSSTAAALPSDSGARA